MGDIRQDVTKDWLVIGWFTPDYRPLAEKLALSLDAHGAPYHLFLREKSAHGWDPRQKPSVALQAMDQHPGKTLVLMDVDCSVRGDIEPVTQIATDVGLSIKARQKHRRREGQQPIVLTISSRVVLFKPTEAARQFALEWERLCRETRAIDDETALAWAYIRRSEIAYTQLDQRYAGIEVNVPTTVKDVVIWHDSAHDPVRNSSIRHLLKSLERRYFRTGRTKAGALQRLG